MFNNQEDFLKELLQDFRIEALEHFHSLVDGLLVLEKESNPDILKNTIEKIFREAHSLKGAARAVNLLDIEKLCMSMESVFNSLKKGETRLNPHMIETLHSALRLLKQLLDNKDYKENPILSSAIVQIIKNLEFVNQSGQINALDTPEETKVIPDLPPASLPGAIERPIEKEIETIRIAPKKLVSLLNQSEDFVAFKSTLEFYKNSLISINNVVQNDELFAIIEDLMRFQRISNRMINNLIFDIKSSLLLPFSSFLNIFPIIVRDLSKEYNKEISFRSKGDHIEIDRRILEEIKEPLIHIVRNCIDHGIETPDSRKSKGKPAGGKIEIEIIQESDKKVTLKIIDDGAGIDKERVISSSIKNGLIDEELAKTLSEKEIYNLIFGSGVSSKEFVTDISGRGLGMAIVSEKVAKLGGSIEIISKKDLGTTFIISLPQVLSTFKGILISVEGNKFVIPSVSLEKAIRIKNKEIQTVGSKNIISYLGESVAFINMSDALDIRSKKNRKDSESFINVLILVNSQKRMAFCVDEVIDEQEGIVKDLGPQLLKIKLISGVTVLGNGKVVPIIDSNELIESASKSKIILSSNTFNKSPENDEPLKRILIAEDSITIRTMLRNFIENAGYFVRTAVDGMDAYKILQSENFDLIVSDIEMPIMNGFELTAKIREMKELSDLPVILVTALESADDQKRGMEAGANAYIVKGSFEKSNLIETIKRLI